MRPTGYIAHLCNLLQINKISFPTDIILFNNIKMNRSYTKLTHIQQLKGQYKSFIQQALLKKFRGRQ